MQKRSWPAWVASLAALSVLFAAACSSSAAPNPNRILVVDKSFDLKTADPHRELNATGAMLAKALYSTLLTFNGSDLSAPIPSLAASYSSSEDARTFTFRLRPRVIFSDGSPLTSADVVFSFDRLISLKAPPSLLLAGVKTSAPDPSTVVLTSTNPNAAIPFSVATPALAIVNANLLGSGPYVLNSFSTFSDIQLTANPRYWGRKPFYKRIVIRNMSGQEQLAYIASATDEVALDLSTAQAGTLMRNSSIAIRAVTGADVVFLFANNNPLVSTVTAEKHFQNAVRYALDYTSIVGLMGAGAIQATGEIPITMLGGLPAWTAPHRDLDKARAELAASKIKNPTVSLGFSTDMSIAGLPISALADMVRSELGAAGITVNLAGAPAASAAADYAAGGEQMGLWPVLATSADPNQYLAFMPGRSLGLRAGWPAAADASLESLGIQASTTADIDTRTQLFQLYQDQLNREGPFFPLVQPGRALVATRDLSGLDFNPMWSIDLAGVSGSP
jgi:peptide/nickel transport system substrate-binding protein